MIKALKRKIVIVLMTILILLLAGILITINIVNYTSSQHRAEEILEKIAKISEKQGPELGQNEHNLRAVQYYIAMMNSNGELLSMTSQGEYEIEDESLYELVDRIYHSGIDRGTIDYFDFQVQRTTTQIRIVLIDNTVILEQLRTATLYSVILGLAGSIILFFVSIIISGWIVKPVRDAFEKQKQFISDASHELKTPLTIMNANIDALEHEYGKSKYFGYIKEEITKMTSLINQLLSLARVEDTQGKANFIKFDLSQAVESASLPFESVAFEKAVQLEIEIVESLNLVGNEGQIMQLVAILVDNAILHTKQNGLVKIQLTAEKCKNILTVQNEGEAIPIEEREQIFERYYRSDQSRNRAEGRYGLGLAIAKSIVDAHKGKIQVDCKKGITTFHVKF